MNRQRQIIDIITKIAPTTTLNDNVRGWLSDLDIVEIFLEIEKNFQVIIDDTTFESSKVEKVSDLVAWLDMSIELYQKKENKEQGIQELIWQCPETIKEYVKLLEEYAFKKKTIEM